MEESKQEKWNYDWIAGTEGWAAGRSPPRARSSVNDDTIEADTNHGHHDHCANTTTTTILTTTTTTTTQGPTSSTGASRIESSPSASRLPQLKVNIPSGIATGPRQPIRKGGFLDREVVSPIRRVSVQGNLQEPMFDLGESEAVSSDEVNMPELGATLHGCKGGPAP